jgi:Xaa-Pro aminopeptidase
MHEQRIKALVKGLGDNACLLEDVYDLYYFSGLRLSCGTLLLSKKSNALFVDGRYFEKAKTQNILDVFPRENLKDHLKDFSFLLFDSAKTSVELFQERQKEFPHIFWEGAPLLTKKQRAIKDVKEQEILRISAELAKKGFSFACEGIKEGIMEKEIAWRFEKFCREHGAEKMAFEIIVAFGDNSAFPHHRASDRKYREGEAVLIDAGCVVQGYSSDMTRTIAGASPEMHRLKKVVEEAQEAALKKCKAGVSLKELDLAAREVMRKENLEQFYIHALGHGVGLETHEYPKLSYKGTDANVILEEGMVITLEPGLYLPGLGGVRREDTVIVRSNGIDNFYGDLP